jgi:hypothetical protein
MFIIAFFAITAFTQPDPNVPGGVNPGIQPGVPQRNIAAIDYNKMQNMMLDNLVNQSELLIELSDSGILIYKAGKLAKLDYFTLKLIKKIELFGPMPEKPAPPVQQAGNFGLGAILQDKDSVKYLEEVNKRIAQTTIVQNENSLLFIIGDNFFKVNPLTMTVELQTNFTKKNVANQPFQIENLKTLFGGGGYQPNYSRNMQINNVIAKTKDNMLVFIKQEEIIIIDTLTGKIIARNQMPEEFLSRPANYQLNQMGPILGQPIMQPGQPFIQPGGVKIPNDNVNKNNRQPGNNTQNPPGLVNEQDMTFLAGTVLMKKGFPTLQCDAGEEYLLTGPKVNELINKTKLNKKYRLMGKISRDKNPPFGIGFFDVFSYLELNGV